MASEKTNALSGLQSKQTYDKSNNKYQHPTEYTGNENKHIVR